VEEARPLTPPVRDQATQSDYRESDTQTDPYTPQYTVAPGSNPELLTLASLSWNNGLPATMAEVELIERARGRRQFEMSLPDISEDAAKWKQMMEEQQMREMAEREEHIKRLQAQRMNLMAEALDKREKEYEFVNLQRLEVLKEKWNAAFARQQEVVRKQRIKMLRKLSRSRKKVGIDAVQPRSIIADYANPVSGVYAPLTRDGRRIDKDAVKFETSYLDSMQYGDLRELERSLPRSMFETSIQKPKLAKHKSAAGARKALEMTQHLDKVESTIRQGRGKAKTVDKFDDLAAYRKAPVIVRPKTPDIHADGDEVSNFAETETFSSAVFLQRLIRGRAAQLRMFAGKERRLQLIKEMRTTEVLPSEQELADRRLEQAAEKHREMMAQGIMQHAAGTEIARMLDYLSKELVRYKEERRLQAMIMLAERQRRMREAQEAGTRDEETVRRDLQDQVFREIMKVNSGTVDSYLEDVIAETVQQEARAQAIAEAEVKVAAVNQIVDSLEAENNDSEVIVTDLVQSFLLPNVQRKDVEGMVREGQKKYVSATAEAMLPVADQVCRDAAADVQEAEGSREEQASEAAAEATPEQASEAAAEATPEQASEAVAEAKPERAAAAAEGGSVAE